MADTRTLKLSLLADVNKFLAGMDKADKGTKSFSSSIGKYSKAMAKSFAVAGAAAGAYAIKLGIDSVKAAAEDEKSSRILQIQLEKTLGANEALTASVEDYITRTQLRVGVQDDKLRPSFARLVRSTKDASKAQELLNLALDISVATGKPLENVANALGKAYDGNAASLGRLGLGLDASVLKAKDFDVIGKELTKTFGGFADKEAKSLEGQLRVVQIRFDELKEDLGKKLLPVMGRVLESVQQVAKAFSGEDPQGLSARARELKGEVGDTSAGSLGRSLKLLADSFVTLFAAFTSDDGESADGMQTIASALVAVAGGINAVSGAVRTAKSVGGKILNTLIIGEGKAGYASFIPGLGFGANGTGGGSRAAGGSVMAGGAYRVGEFGPEMFVPSGSGSIRSAAGAGDNVVININGAVDANGTRRQLEQLFKTSSRQMGLVNLNGARL
jgi:hypothetical protein